MASDRRLRTTNSPRMKKDERRLHAAAGSPVGDVMGSRTPHSTPRPDGLNRSVRTASGRRRVSTRRVAGGRRDRRADRDRTPRWRPYAPSTVAPLDIWGTDRHYDERPLAQELTPGELATEALTALRIDRAVPAEEPWLLDLAAAAPPRVRSRPRHAAAHVAAPAVSEPSPVVRLPPVSTVPSVRSGPRHAAERVPAHRHLARTPRRSHGRAVWIAVAAAAIAVAAGIGWSMALAAGAGGEADTERVSPPSGQSMSPAAPGEISPASATPPAAPPLAATPQPTATAARTSPVPSTPESSTPAPPVQEASAVVVTLEPGDPGFGWPLSAFGQQ